MPPPGRWLKVVGEDLLVRRKLWGLPWGEPSDFGNHGLQACFVFFWHSSRRGFEGDSGLWDVWICT